MREVELFRHRDLPHWDVPGATYFVTCCLDGSIPARGLVDLRRYEDRLRSQDAPPNLAVNEVELHRWKLAFARMDWWLDREPAACHLKDPRLASSVMDAILHFASERYEVYALVVMPSHFHWVFRPLQNWVQTLVSVQSPRERIMQGLKTFTARCCNALLGRQGQFWQEESYDHWVRDEDELFRILQYVENNPVVAGLVDKPEEFPFSSARIRKLHGLQMGAALSKW